MGQPVGDAWQRVGISEPNTEESNVIWHNGHRGHRSVQNCPGTEYRGRRKGVYLPILMGRVYTGRQIKMLQDLNLLEE